MLPDYARDILGRLEGVKPSGDSGRQFVACCPAHKDSEQSLSVGVTGDRILLRCFTGCVFSDIVAALGLTPADLFQDKKEKAEPNGVTVARLAFEKRLPDSWLREFCKLEDVRTGENWVVEIPYLDAAGAEMFRRVRSAVRAKQGSSYKRTGTKSRLYGLWLRDGFLAAGQTAAVIVEGETDCWALWRHGFAALGVPGATNLKAIQEGDLAGFQTVYVWREPGDAGTKFPHAVGHRLREVGFAGRVVVASAAGAKDPADVQARHGDRFRDEFAKFLAAAVEWVPAAAPPADVLPATVKRIEDRLRQTGVCPWGDFEFSDVGNAGRLERLHGANLRYVSQWSSWLAWDGKRWVEDGTGEVVRRAIDTVHSLPLEAALSPGVSGRAECLKWFGESQKARSVRAMVEIARCCGRVPAEHDAFNRHPWLLNCPNGTVDLRTGDVRPHRREELITTLCPTAYEPDAACPAWLRFLDLVFGGDAELIGFVQKLLGYCLTGDVGLNVLPIFWGAGANGKSTLLNTIQDAVGPGYTMQAPDGFLMAKHGEQHPTELADLFGKRMVVVAETKERRRLDEGLVKRLTGGENVRARRMRENFWEFSPTHKIILCTNHPPQIKGTDRGIWRRIMRVPFQVTFWNPDDGETGPDHLKQDPGLRAKLQAEATGVLAWLVRGCVAWVAEGLKQPEEVRKATASYRQEEDVLGRFLDERYVKCDDAYGVSLKDVREGLGKWCDENDEHLRLSSHALGDQLRTRGYKVVKGTANRTLVKGLAPAERAANPDVIPY